MTNRKFLLYIVLLLMPMLYGIYFWNELPQEIPLRVTSDGDKSWVFHKSVALIALPILICLGFLYKCNYEFKRISGISESNDTIYSKILLRHLNWEAWFIVLASHLLIISIIMEYVYGIIIPNEFGSLCLCIIAVFTAIYSEKMLSLDIQSAEEYVTWPIHLQESLQDENKKYLLNVRIMLIVLALTCFVNIFLKLEYLDMTFLVLIYFVIIVYAVIAERRAILGRRI